jgi:cation-transporting P-type ATPase 13A2
MITVTMTLAVTIYMVLRPARAMTKLMQLTYISWSFKAELLWMGALYLLLAWTAETYLFQQVARWVGSAKLTVTKIPKKRKEYKVILEKMQA